MVKNLLLWLIIAAVLLTVFKNFNPQTSQAQLKYSEFLEASISKPCVRRCWMKA